MHRCTECNYETGTMKALTRHTRKHHDMSYEDYVVKLKHDNVHPTCQCECGQNVKFYKGKFRRFVAGHQARDPTISKRIVENMRLAFETTDALKRMAHSVKERWKTDEYRRNIAASRDRPDSKFKTVRVQKIRDHHSTPEYKQRLRDMKHALWDDPEWAARTRAMMRSDAFREKVGTATSQALHEPETNRRLLQGVAAAYARGTKRAMTNWKHVRRCWMHNPFTSHDEWMDSSYESEFLQRCIDAGIAYTKDHGIAIPYEHDGDRSATYHPDFLLSDLRIIVETKGRSVMLDDVKHEALQLFCREAGFTCCVLHRRDFDAFFGSL